MTKKAFDKIAEGLNEALSIARGNSEPVGFDWLSQFREQFPEEFPEDKKARDHVEKDGSRPAKQKRYQA